MLHNNGMHTSNSPARRLAVIDTNFPWKQSGFRYWENVEIWKQRPDTLFFATKLYYDDFPAKVHDIRSFGAMAEREGITDIYCVFLNHLLSLLGEIRSSEGTMMPGANPLVSIRNLIDDLGIRVHAMLYPGGGLMPGTEEEFLNIAGSHCETVFTNIQEVRKSISKSVYMPVVINTDFYTFTAKEKTVPLQITFCTYKAVRKNFPLLADIFNRIDERFQLNIIGDWETELHLLKNSNYTFYEKLNPEQIKEIYEHTHIFLYCGIADPYTLDGFPTTSACDAMASGCLLITTNPRNDHSLLIDRQEYIEASDSADSFLRHINWAYENFDEAMRIAEAGAKKIREHFNAAHIVDRKLALIFGVQQADQGLTVKEINEKKPLVPIIQTFLKGGLSGRPGDFTLKRILFIHPLYGGIYKVISEGIIEGFRGLGADVLELQPKENAADLAAKIKPDLLFVLLGDSFPVQQARAIAEMGIKTAIWFIDDLYYPDVTMKLAPYYDYVFTQEKSSVTDYYMAGCRNVHYMPLGISTQYFSREEDVSFTHDVCILGTAGKSRLDIAAKLAPYLAEKKAVIAGTGGEDFYQYKLYPDKVRIEAFSQSDPSQVMKESKIVINHHGSQEETDLLREIQQFSDLSSNPGTLGISTYGVFQLTDKKGELSRFLEIGSEIETYSSSEELIAKIEYYLKHEKERTKIAKKGHERIFKEHSYYRRAMTILDMIFKPDPFSE
ncbi:glycosyltransferase family protein [Bacillus infantis]|uniref:glycosyltransferase family protein n=1 Tax=Bacillus infantis TaxID=324767 RepID=UPI003CF9194B